MIFVDAWFTDFLGSLSDEVIPSSRMAVLGEMIIMNIIVIEMIRSFFYHFGMLLNKRSDERSAHTPQNNEEIFPPKIFPFRLVSNIFIFIDTNDICMIHHHFIYRFMMIIMMIYVIIISFIMILIKMIITLYWWWWYIKISLWKNDTLRYHHGENDARRYDWGPVIIGAWNFFSWFSSSALRNGLRSVIFETQPWSRFSGSGMPYSGIILLAMISSGIIFPVMISQVIIFSRNGISTYHFSRNDIFRYHFS